VQFSSLTVRIQALWHRGLSGLLRDLMTEALSVERLTLCEYGARLLLIRVSESEILIELRWDPRVSFATPCKLYRARMSF
jgi:hypothetical protein